MATALAYPEASKLKRAGSSSFLKKDQDAPSEGHISKARFVLRNCRDKAEEVLRNATYPLREWIQTYPQPGLIHNSLIKKPPALWITFAVAMRVAPKQARLPPPTRGLTGCY